MPCEEVGAEQDPLEPLMRAVDEYRYDDEFAKETRAKVRRVAALLCAWQREQAYDACAVSDDGWSGRDGKATEAARRAYEGEA